LRHRRYARNLHAHLAMKRTSQARLFENLAARSRHDEAERIMHRAEPVAEKLDDYFVIIKRWARLPRHHRNRWTWEIQRRSKPLRVKYNGNDFATPQDARLAGERALKELLAPTGRGRL
jgi:hypothetical protein